MPKKESPKPQPPKKTLSSYIFTTLLLFALLIVAYSSISNMTGKRPQVVTLSEVARAAQAGQVKSIVVSDQDLIVTKTDDTVLKSKKEANASLVETLATYGVTNENLNKIDILVSSQSGFM